MIFRDERLEDSEVTGEEKAVENHQNDAERFCLGNASVANMYCIENQEYNAAEAQRHAAGFFQGYRFFQHYRRHKHRENRRYRSDDGSV